MFVSTTDDTTVFAFEGAVDGKVNDLFIVNKQDDSGVRSSYTKDTSSTDSLRGIRIRHTVSFNGVGNTAPLYITIYGLTKEELPVATCTSGVFPILLEGLCYGSNQDCSNRSIGHVVFLRNTEKGSDISTDQLNHERYRNEVFLPYIQSTREHYLRREGWQGGDEVDDDHVWINWQVRSSIYNIVIL